METVTRLFHEFVAAVESLSKHKGDLNLDALTELSDAAAKSLSKHQGDLRFQRLQELSDAAAESLSKHQGDLFLYGRLFSGLEPVTVE